MTITHYENSDADDDARLADAWCSGDLRAGDRLLRRHVPALRRYIAARGVVEVADLDDLVQETLLAVLRNRRRLGSRRAVRAYLFAAGRCKVIDAARWRGRNERRHATVDEDDLTVDHDDALIADEASVALTDALAALPAELGIPLAAYFLEERTATEIGARLGVPQGTVRTRVRRALQLVRADVEPCAIASVRGVERWSALSRPYAQALPPK